MNDPVLLNKSPRYLTSVTISLLLYINRTFLVLKLPLEEIIFVVVLVALTLSFHVSQYNSKQYS